MFRKNGLLREMLSIMLGGLAAMLMVSFLFMFTLHSVDSKCGGLEGQELIFCAR